MPYKVPNVLSYSPFGHGGGLTKAVANLFGGGNQADGALKQSQADMNRAHGEYYLAQRDAALAKMEAEAQARRDMATAPMEAIAPLFGSRPQAQMWMDSMNNGSTPVAEFRPPADVDTGVAQQPSELVPQQFDPTAVARAGRLMTALGAMKAMPGNDNGKHLADAIAGLYADEVKQGALNGTVTNPQIQRVGAATAATGGHALYKNLGEVGTFNQFTGEQGLNPLGNAKVELEGAKVKTEDTKQLHNRAQAGAASAAARLSDARTTEIGRLVPVTDPNDGKTYMVPEGKAGLSVLGRENKKDVAGTTAALKPPGAEKAPIKISPEVLRTELGRLTEEEAGKRALDPMFANQVVSRAMALAQESGGEFWNKPVEAVRVALMEATGGKDLTDITGSWRDRNKRFAPPGFKPQQSGGAITPAPATGAPKSPTSAPAPPPGFKVVN